MTVKQLQDIVYAKFPNVGETMADKFIEEGMRVFCQQTLIYKAAFYYDADGSSTQFKLDSDVLSTDAVYVRDTADALGTGAIARKLVGNPLDTSFTTTDFLYSIQNGFLLVGTMSDGVYVPIESGKKIVLMCRSVPSSLEAAVVQYNFNNGTNGDIIQSNGVENPADPADVEVFEAQKVGNYDVTPGIPEQFHMAFAYHAMRVLSELSSDYPAAGYMNNRFAEFVRDGRKWASRQQTGNMQTIPYYY